MFVGVVLLLGGLAALLARRRGANLAANGTSIWLLSGLGLLVMGAVRLFGWDNEFAQTIRLESIHQGWYADRRPAQALLILVLTVVAAALIWRLTVSRSAMSFAEKLMVVVVLVLAALLSVRAVSYHWTDQLFGLRGGNSMAPGSVAIWVFAFLAFSIAIWRAVNWRAPFMLQGGLMSAGVLAVFAVAMLYPSPHLSPERALSPVGSIAAWEADGFVTSGGVFESKSLRLEYAVPDGSTIVGAILYWSGEHVDSTGDQEVVVDGKPVKGNRVGGPTYFYTSKEKINESAFRADVTEFALAGSSMTVAGASFDELGGGAAVFVFYQNPGSGSANSVELRDGLNLAFQKFKPPLDAVVPQRFSIAAADQDRPGTISLVVSGFDSRYNGALRPSVVEVRAGGKQYTWRNELGADGSDGWDLVNLPFTVPAGSTTIEVILLSEGVGSVLLPASFAWVVAGLQVLPNHQ
ncbi:MAG: hypothetical protein AB7J35_09705 [Dehalococcoidia bacterium]